MKKLHFFTIILLSCITVTNANTHTKSLNIEVSVLTCSETSDLYASFGHTALRINDLQSGKDLVYDYGVFNFDEPNFVIKFMRGELLYWVESRSFQSFMRSFERQGRRVREDVLELDSAQISALLLAIEDNLKPENLYYKYDFIEDNCATRVRDFFLTNDFIYSASPSIGVRSSLTKDPASHEPQHKRPEDWRPMEANEGRTFRDNFDYYLDSRKWLQLGINLLLGQRVDKEMSFSDKMFLPYALSENLKEIKSKSSSESIVKSTEIIYPGKQKKERKGAGLTQPLIVFSILFLLTVYLSFRKNKLINTIRITVYAVLFLGSLVIMFMWFASSHDATSANWNLLWINPLYLLLLLFPNKSFTRYVAWGLSILAIITFVLWFVIPQEFSVAVIPVIAMILLLNLKKFSNILDKSL